MYFGCPVSVVRAAPALRFYPENEVTGNLIGLLRACASLRSVQVAVYRPEIATYVHHDIGGAEAVTSIAPLAPAGMMRSLLLLP